MELGEGDDGMLTTPPPSFLSILGVLTNEKGINGASCLLGKAKDS